MPFQCPNCETLLIAGTRRCPVCARELEPARGQAAAPLPAAPASAPSPVASAHAASPAAESGREKRRSPDVLIEVEDAGAVRLPGDRVRVRATLTGDGERVNEARVGLVRAVRYKVKYVDGDGEEREKWEDDDTLVCGEVLAWEGELPHGFSKTVEPEWALPADAAPSCAGKIVQARWLVRARVNIPWGFDLMREVELKVAAPPPAGRPEPGEYGRMITPGYAGALVGLDEPARETFEGVSLRLLLPKLEYAEGETLEGVLLVRVEQDVDVQEVTARLVRFERVGGNTRTVRGEPVRLAAAGRLRAAQPLAYNFRLPVDARGCPTSATEHGAVEWYLMAALERSLFSRDYATVQKLDVRAASHARPAHARGVSAAPADLTAPTGVFAATAPAAPTDLTAPTVPRVPGGYALQPAPAPVGVTDSGAGGANAPRAASEGRKGLAVVALALSALALAHLVYFALAAGAYSLFRPLYLNCLAAIVGALMGRRALARARRIPHLFGGALPARAAVVLGLLVVAHTLLTTLLAYASALLL